ncbi:MAG TPA: YggS family pyridoxal phosphate-dependent enzyme [Sphaerochaeta sp.]|jgi:pyridoxal phosphate enzyme (YggS family)|nr:YggS family pyridoxal phosphate-dependent enzyme [Spirochaetota bacterium]NLV60332.1 YggS family pyridoxal phosphate-dependent enzyme [Spirochaetales bacterium]HOE83817.1 YggS family pyridoxal phosphate-dependent enzyme [Sphaerochaeta sp.]HOQ94284.1 YggS family pyridoxal phosphate-dependent enzyme [Sphaerochaeta sp.]HPK46720.1 YggS family pyridoxal phosphate-dependent enzyme [Sphaerochaeta sp.]
MRREELAANLLAVQSALAEAIAKSGRSQDSVRLMAVSKTHPYEAMLALCEEGQLLFGENRVQEGEGKLPPKGERPLSVNLIGHLQGNKAKKAIALFDRIDSVDSLRLARRLNDLVSVPYPILLELNTSGEAAKHGFESEDALFFALDEIATMENLRVEGLLTLGPLGGDERAIRTSFAALRRSFERARERFDLPSFFELSMGMSGDWPLAIAEGSTCVRIGTLLFGAREAP